MNQQCRVCGEPAAGFHFGAFTCEGCKSFFGRTFNNQHSVSECKNNGQCVINKKNRTSCKACRLKKCLTVGMSKSGSRYGRRSNWFKIHCLLQEQQSYQGNHNKWEQEEGNNNVVMGGHLWPERPPLVWPLPLLMPLQSILPGPLPSSAPPLPPPPPLPSLQDPLTRLQSLGPVQDTPIDLSKSSSKSPPGTIIERCERPPRPSTPNSSSSSRSPSQEQTTANKTPLDLTCVK